MSSGSGINLEVKACPVCQESIQRRVRAKTGAMQNRLETPAQYRTRKFCSRACAARGRKFKTREAHPVCYVCAVPLTVGVNISQSRLSAMNYCCNDHSRARINSWASTHRETLKDRRCRREYQISREDWEKMYRQQQGLCGVCGKPIGGFVGTSDCPTPAIDHDHQTGLIRGLLHAWCNRLLGYVRDNIDLARGLANYLENPPAIQALGGQKFTAPGRIGTKRRRKLLKQLKVTS
jgi:hypothetical protein